MARKKIVVEAEVEPEVAEEQVAEVEAFPTGEGWLEATPEQAAAAEAAGILAGYDPVNGLILISKGDSNA